MSAATPDAKLVSAFQQWSALDGQVCANEGMELIDDDAFDRLVIARDVVVDSIADMTPQTVKGRQAKARVAYVSLLRQVKVSRTQSVKEQAAPVHWLVLEALREAAGIAA